MSGVPHRVGSLVAAHRRAAGITQAELGERTGYSRSSISHIEAGVQELTVTTLLALARALGVSPSALLVFDGDVDLVESLVSSIRALRQLVDDTVQVLPG